MATDHRGRDVHAGKRTVQEEVSSWNNESRDYPGGGIPPYAGPSGTVPPEGYPAYSAEHNNMWMHVGGVDGRFHWSMGDYGQSNVPAQGRTAVSAYGSARTSYRAMVAAKAMSNRVREGRNLRTGRPTT